MNIQIVTLNCWGIPVISKHRKDRIEAIGDELSNGIYDIAVLQEVWSNSDFDLLSKSVEKVLPHSHYFHCGVIGSGVCLFSKFRIVDVVDYPYTLNGYAHKFYHGDWFGGKLVGLVKMKVSNFTLHVYATHIHAEYARDNDEYLAHRVAQSLQLSQFIRATKGAADVSILAGDLNLEPNDVGFRLIKEHVGFFDAWMDQSEKKDALDVEGHSCESPSNTYTSAGAASKRIDYILYASNVGHSVECRKCAVALKKVPGKDFSFSDHDGVVASLSIKPSADLSSLPKLAPAEQQEVLTEAHQILGIGLSKISMDQKYFFMLFIVCLVLELTMALNEFPYGLLTLIGGMRVLAAIGMGASFWMGLILCRSETNGIIAAQKTVSVIQNSLSHDKHL